MNSIRSELCEKIVALQSILPKLKTTEFEMLRIETYVHEFLSGFKNATSGPFVSEALIKMERLSRNCQIKRMMVKFANEKIEDTLQLVTEPESLLELGMDRVVELRLPLDNLPRTLAPQVSEWPIKREECDKFKLFLIDKLKVDIFFELSCIFG